MVVDTSALVAILLGEPDAQSLIDALDTEERSTISAASVLEATIVIHARLGTEGLGKLQSLLKHLELDVQPFDEQQLPLARYGFVHFGKGRHPAALNFGDCFVYGLAKLLAQPVLFVGDDFSQTDLKAVLAQP